MGFFFRSPRKKVSSEELSRVLSGISILGASERAYVKATLRQYSRGGLSVREVDRVVRELKRDTDDRISTTEANAVRRALREYLRESEDDE